MVECTSSDDRKIELILLGIVAGGFFTYLLTRLLFELELLRRAMSTNNQYLYQQPASYIKKIETQSSQKQIFTVDVDNEGMIKHNDLDN